MRNKGIILAASITGALLAANVMVQSHVPAAGDEPPQTFVDTTNPEDMAGPTSAAPPQPEAGSKLIWTDIETTNYPHYVGNLRGVGFPEVVRRKELEGTARSLR